MQMNPFGRTGLPVSALCLGTMSLRTSSSEAEAIRLVHRAPEAGITLVDTADIYDNGAVEEVLGRALKG